MSWAWHRERYTSAAGAVQSASWHEGLIEFEKDPLVVASLLQIEMAERVIAHRADQIMSAYHGEDE